MKHEQRHEDSRGQIFIGALQANPDWVADVLQSIVDAAEGRNIERAVTSVPVGMAIDGTVVYAEGGAR